MILSSVWVMGDLSSFKREVAMSGFLRQPFKYGASYQGPLPIKEQIQLIGNMFELETREALHYAQRLPPLPEGAEGWFAIPSMTALSVQFFSDATDPNEQYEFAVVHAMRKLRMSRRMEHDRKGSTLVWRPTEQTTRAFTRLQEYQPGSIHLMAAQFGLRHAGCSVLETQSRLVDGEFGLPSFVAICLLLTHPQRIEDWNDLDVTCSGDVTLVSRGEKIVPYSPTFFSTNDKLLHRAAAWVGYKGEQTGQATGFLPP